MGQVKFRSSEQLPTPLPPAPSVRWTSLSLGLGKSDLIAGAETENGCVGVISMDKDLAFDLYKLFHQEMEEGQITEKAFRIILPL